MKEYCHGQINNKQEGCLALYNDFTIFVCAGNTYEFMPLILMIIKVYSFLCLPFFIISACIHLAFILPFPFPNHVVSNTIIDSNDIMNQPTVHEHEIYVVL